MSSSLDIVSLESFLQEANIPEIKPRPKTFLGIAKQPHYENVISNIYAFYFDVNEEHGLNDLFVQSLLNIIFKSPLGQDKHSLRSFNNFGIIREEIIPNGRIDLILRNVEQAIIIENKVYHFLANELNNYWNSINLKESNKIGVVLSLHPISDIQHDQFINITHLDLMKEITTNLGKYILSANHKYFVFLQDFIQNIFNMSTKQADSKSIEFYFKNLSRIKEIRELHDSLYSHVIGEIELAGRKQETLDFWGPPSNSDRDSRVRYYVSKVNRDLMFAVVFNEIFESKTLFIKIQLKNSLLKNKDEYKSITLSKSEEEIHNSEFYSVTQSWGDFAIGEYTLEEDEVTDLSLFIQSKLESDSLLSIFRKLEQYLIKQEI